MWAANFAFVRELAAKQPSFTVPPLFVLWLFLRIKDAVCLLAEDSDHGPLAYMLAVPIEAETKTLYVWQLASNTIGDNQQAALALVREFANIAHRLSVNAITFSSTPDSASMRAVTRYTKKVFRTIPNEISALPSLVCESEHEYGFKLISD